MKKVCFVFAAALTLVWADGARAFGRRAARGACQPVVCCRPAPCCQPAPSYAPVYQGSVAMPQPGADGVQPAFYYGAEPGGRPAYYYTYDSSGRLIVRQWMDWTFRGGREAGMARPPLPVIGWFTR